MACHITLALLPLKLILPLFEISLGRSCHQSTALPTLCSRCEGIKQNVVYIYCQKVKDLAWLPLRPLIAHYQRISYLLFIHFLTSMDITPLWSLAHSWIEAAGAAIAGPLPKNIKACDPITYTLQICWLWVSTREAIGSHRRGCCSQCQQWGLHGY